MTKKKDESPEPEAKYIGIGGTEVLATDPSAGAEAFGVAAEPQVEVPQPHIEEGAK